MTATHTDKQTRSGDVHARTAFFALLSSAMHQSHSFDAPSDFVTLALHRHVDGASLVLRHLQSVHRQLGLVGSTGQRTLQVAVLRLAHEGSQRLQRAQSEQHVEQCLRASPRNNDGLEPVQVASGSFAVQEGQVLAELACCDFVQPTETAFSTESCLATHSMST